MTVDALSRNGWPQSTSVSAPIHGLAPREADVLVSRRTNLLIILGMMQVAKKIPFDDPTVLNLCRAAYAASNVIILGIYLYIKTVVDRKKGKFLPAAAAAIRPAPRRFDTCAATRFIGDRQTNRSPSSH